jgi:hypothetical protein
MKRLIHIYRRNKFYARLPIESEPCESASDPFGARKTYVDLTQAERDLIERLGFEVGFPHKGETYLYIYGVIERALRAGIPDRTLAILLKVVYMFELTEQVVERIEDWYNDKNRVLKLLINTLMILSTPLLLPYILSLFIPMFIITGKYTTDE